MMVVSATAFADAVLDFEVTEVGYDNGVLKAAGVFTNSGDRAIEKVNKVDVKIFLYNDDGDSKEVANHYFTDLAVQLAPGESIEYTLEFPDVAEYEDATQWSAEEGDWEFTYLDEAVEEVVVYEEEVVVYEEKVVYEEEVVIYEEEVVYEEEAVVYEEEAVYEDEVVYEEAAVEEEAAILDFQITSVYFEDGKLMATGKFINTGSKNIETVESVYVKIWLYNEAGDSEQAADHVFSGLSVHLMPGEEIEYTLEFVGVPEYTDATAWDASEEEWTFTYFE
ncbi:hypothetical protein ACFOSW_07670 [Paenibacillus sp. GCM10012303]